MVLTSHDIIKDSVLAAFGFLPGALTQVDVAIIFGLLNLLVVILFRLFELRRRGKRDQEIARLQAHIAQLTGKEGN